MAEPQPADIGVAEQLRPEVLPRTRWAGDLVPVGSLANEDDVRFILIHHTASGNDYGRDETAEEIRNFYRLHIGPGRGWSDVAYNFLVDRFGRIWEGRDGSLDRAVRGDATGGSQGFALLCALIGDHHDKPVSEEAATALIRLVAWLGERHGIDTTPGSEVAFVSRGSNRWPAGTKVVTTTIAGHRAMSLTSCPGDAAYTLITERLPAAATELRRKAGSQVGVDADSDRADLDRAAPDDVTDDGATAEPGSGVSPGDDAEPNSGWLGTATDVAPDGGSSGETTALVGLGTGGTAALAALGALLALRRRRAL